MGYFRRIMGYFRHVMDYILPVERTSYAYRSKLRQNISRRHRHLPAPSGGKQRYNHNRKTYPKDYCCCCCRISAAAAATAATAAAKVLSLIHI